LSLYKTILFDKLQIRKAFLDDRRRTLREKLYTAAEDMKLENGDIFAINQCLQLASSIVLQFSMHLGSTFDFIRSFPELRDKNPSTVLTVAALYYLLERELDCKTRSARDKAKVELLHKRFDEINWLIGQEAMDVLGFQRESASRPSRYKSRMSNTVTHA
jgi:hypothetical protein